MLKKLLPFATLGLFTLFANVILVFSIYFLHDISSVLLAKINFGVYVISFFTTICEALYRYLTIKLTSNNADKFKNILLSVYINATPIVATIITVINIIFVAIYPEHLLILLLTYTTALVFYIFTYFRAWVNAMEKYLFLGLLLLPVPLSRLISSFYISKRFSYIEIFISALMASLILVLISVYYLKRKYNIDISFPIKEKYEVNIKEVLINISLQLALNCFWIFDGIILNKSLNPNQYTSYTTLSLIYKFPFFISASFLMVILGKNISSVVEKKRFSKYLIFGLMLVVAVFTPVILFEYFNSGFIHSVMGYGKYYVDGISLFFGVAWLLETLTFVMYSSSLKIAPKNINLFSQIFIYTLTFILGISIFNTTLLTITYFLIFHGLSFFILSSYLVIGLIKKWNY